MIKLTHVNKVYQMEKGACSALTDINLQVNPGEIYGIIGRSGAGKSTLIRCINLLERPTSGSVEVNGRDLMTLSESELRQARCQMGMVFQQFNLLATRTVYENVALPLVLLKQSKATIDKAVMPLLELTGLEAHKNAYPGQLSGGQQQRVAISRALATQPSVLLCDEMTSALDPNTTDSILDLIRDIHQQLNLSIVLITHEMGVIKKIADQVAVLDAGTIIEQADIVSLFKNPQTDVAKTFTESLVNTELPHLLHEQLSPERVAGAHTVIRVTFTGKAAAEPLIDDLVKRFDVRINILQANLEFLRCDTIGMMIATVWGEQDETLRAIDSLKEKGLTVEVLGYVAADDWILV